MTVFTQVNAFRTVSTIPLEKVTTASIDDFCVAAIAITVDVEAGTSGEM